MKLTQKNNSFVVGAFIIAISNIIVKIIGAVYKIPLDRYILGTEGMGIYSASYTIYNLLTEQKEQGVAVIFVGEDLDVLIDLCDRILVISGGRVTGIVAGRTAKKEKIGILMTKGKGGDLNEQE